MDPLLRCPPGATRHNMSTIPIRYFCYDDDEFGQIKNSGAYELLHRTDEDLSVSVHRHKRLTQLWPRALLVTEMWVSNVIGESACTLLSGVMKSGGRDIVKTPG